MNDRTENHIAAQALGALRLRRQWDRGELTHQEYLASLDALDGTPDPPAANPTQPAAKADTEPEGTKSDQPANEGLLIGALELLQARRRREDAKLAPQEDLMPARRVPEPAPRPDRTPTAAPPVSTAPPIVTPPPAAREQLAAVKSPGSAGNLMPGPKRQAPNHRARRMLVAAAGIFVLIAAFQALAFRGHIGPAPKSLPQDTAAPAAQAVPPADLIVSEAGFVGPAGRRRIAGILKNSSGNSYTDIHLTFCLIGADGDTVGLVTATVDRIGARETTGFESPDVKLKAAELVLKNIETHPSVAGTR